MNECKFTKFGLSVKMRLLESGMTQECLADKVSDETGMFVDRSYLYKIFTGQRAAPKIVSAIQTILGMEVEQDE